MSELQLLRSGTREKSNRCFALIADIESSFAALMHQSLCLMLNFRLKSIINASRVIRELNKLRGLAGEKGSIPNIEHPHPIGLAGGINTYAYAEGAPTMKTDPFGLATYICIKPMQGAEKLYFLPKVNHTFVCVGGGLGNMTCGSTTASTDGVFLNIKEGSPGKPTTPDRDYFRPDSCERRWDKDSCIESCIANELKKPDREWYAVGPRGEDCQEYTWRIVHTCDRRCGRR